MAGWARRADVIKQFIAMGRIAHLKNSSNGAEIFLVGTAHVSAKSAEEVEEVIGIVKPDIVAVELCEERAKKLLAGYHDTSLFQKVQEFMKFPGGLKQKVVHLALSASYQAMREAGLEPGKEFKVAMEEAKARRAGILLIDQRYDVTISKLTKAIRIRDVINLLGIAGADMEQIVEGLSSGNLIESIEKLK
ncbi:traB domain-containing protein isoform X2 [Selaginella moellendorffii]|nr:traB domain-containing protein isoform X2 [Selaginella moellendorffii]|eukprot:XP_002979246.2 traB domain-containing protein isoform X2 [Selaginella moellendorffii]